MSDDISPDLVTLEEALELVCCKQTAEIEQLRALVAALAKACKTGLSYHEAIEAMDPSPFAPEPEAVWERNAALYQAWIDSTRAAIAMLLGDAPCS
jgi:hypothetical protein